MTGCGVAADPRCSPLMTSRVHTPAREHVAPPGLPRRPRLRPDRPMLWRGPTTAQLGLDARHAVVVDALSPGLSDLLRALDGTRSFDDLVAAAALAGSAEADARALLSDLAAAGLLEDADSTPRQATGIPGWVVVRGGGRVGIGVATLLAAAGLPRVHLSATGTVTAGDLGSGYLPTDVGCPRQPAAAAAVRRAAPGGDVATAAPGSQPVDLVVLADALVVDPVVLTELVADRTPHLAARVRDGIGVVGPLVLPGRTSCLRCADLHRSQADPCWPALAGQLLGRPAVASPACALATAALAAEQALALLARAGTGAGAGAPPATLDATLEIDTVSGRLQRRVWPPSPDCSCGAA